MTSAPALAGLLVASAGVSLQWLRFLRGEDISEPFHIPPIFGDPVCEPRVCAEDALPERRRVLLDFLLSPGLWVEFTVGYIVGLHLILCFVLCRYGCHRCRAPPSPRRTGIRTRIEGAVPAGHAGARELRDGSGVAPRALALEPGH